MDSKDEYRQRVHRIFSDLHDDSGDRVSSLERRMNLVEERLELLEEDAKKTVGGR